VITTAIVVVVPHCPAAGVNVYVVVPGVAVLIVAGLHVPEILFVLVVGNAGGAEFWQSGPIAANVGVAWLVTTTVMVIVVPHCPAVGVNVYVVEPTAAVLMVAGLQVPVILLLEVVGSAGAVLFWHKGPICVNVGAMALVTTIVMVVGAPWPAAGVKV
jgi:hypothetical protein